MVTQAVAREASRLRSFIRKYVSDAGEAEDILQEVFYELIETYRLLRPVEHVTGWLFQVARNRIIDLFRKQRPESLNAPVSAEEEAGTLEDLLPSADAGPEAAYARGLLLDAVEDAIEDLPAAQREVFVAHELMGQSFKEISAETGVSVNTLLSRKHYAVVYLRERLQSIYNDYGRQ